MRIRPHTSKILSAAGAIFLGCALQMLEPGLAARAQVTSVVTMSEDAFVCTGSTNYNDGEDLSDLNFGASGLLAVAPAASLEGEFQTLLKFNLSNSVALFDSTYGANNWTITGVTLDLASNYGVAGVQPNNHLFNAVSGGEFIIEWLADDQWTEGTGTPSLPTADGVTYDDLPTLLAEAHEQLSTNSYVPPGNNAHVFWPLALTPGLMTNLTAGGDVSFLLYAADNQVSYLFNSYIYGRGNEPQLLVTAASLPWIKSGAFTQGAFVLTAVGRTNATYEVQACANLAGTNWQILGPVTADAAGAIRFADTNATALPFRFYRLSQ